MTIPETSSVFYEKFKWRWVLGTRYWVLDAGYWILDAGCRMQDAR